MTISKDVATQARLEIVRTLSIARVSFVNDNDLPDARETREIAKNLCISLEYIQELVKDKDPSS